MTVREFDPDITVQDIRDEEVECIKVEFQQWCADNGTKETDPNEIFRYGWAAGAFSRFLQERK